MALTATATRAGRVWLRRTARRVTAQAGGRKELKVVGLLAAVLALSSADRGTIGVIAPDLKAAFHIGNSDIGLLAAAFGVVSSVASVPVGVLTDRWRRTTLLAGSVVLWVIAMAVSGLATSFSMLFVCRLGLGVVTATAGPTLLSLVGDQFSRRKRGRVLGLVRTGDLLGTGIAYMLVGGLASAFGWRGAFWALALPAAWLAWMLFRLPEPPRGVNEQDHEPGAEGATEPTPNGRARTDGAHHDFATRPDAGRPDGGPGHDGDEAEDDPTDGTGDHGGESSNREVSHAPDPGDADPGDPDPGDPDPANRDPGEVDPGDAGRDGADAAAIGQMGLWAATKYVLSVPTIRVVLIAVSIGDFFFAGIDVFLLVFVEHQYHVGRAVVIGILPLVGAAALIGTIGGGRLGDYLQRRGVTAGRLWVGAIGYALAAVMILPALAIHSFLAVVPLLALGAAGLAAPIPSIDAVRLDVVDHQVWGRSEAIRTLIKTGAGAGGPAIFGVLSDVLGGGGQHGLQLTILVMLPLLLANGLLLLFARHAYARDAEAARAAAVRRRAGQPAT